MKRLTRACWSTAIVLASICTNDAIARAPVTGTKLTHTYEDELIQPLATLEAAGRSIVLYLGGPAREHPLGTRIRVRVTVYQPFTGAVAFGMGNGFPVPPDGPATAIFSRQAHAVGRQPFIAGPAVAGYVAEEIRSGEVVRSWSRSADIWILEEE